AVIVAAGVLAGLASRFPIARADDKAAKVIEAEKFVLVEPGGQLRAEWSTRNEGQIVYLTIKNRNGRDRINMYAADGGLGGIAGVAAALAAKGVNIGYAYGSAGGQGDRARLYIRVINRPAAEADAVIEAHLKGH